MTTPMHSSTTSDSLTTQEAKTKQKPYASTTRGRTEPNTSLNEHQGFHQVFIYWDERP